MYTQMTFELWDLGKNSSLLPEFSLFVTGHDETAQFSRVHGPSVAHGWEIVTL